MNKLEMPKTAEKKLELGDYVSVFEPDATSDRVISGKPFDMQVQRDALFQRIQRQREKLILKQREELKVEPEGKLIDVRNRHAA